MEMKNHPALSHGPGQLLVKLLEIEKGKKDSDEDVADLRMRYVVTEDLADQQPPVSDEEPTDKLPSDDYEELAVDEVPFHEELPVGEEGTYDCEVELLRMSSYANFKSQSII